MLPSQVVQFRTKKPAHGVECEDCGGEGYVISGYEDRERQFWCERCDGTGRVEEPTEEEDNTDE